MDERDVLNAWRQLFRAQPVTSQTLAKAESLLDGLSGESPLHVRLANELNELNELKGSHSNPKKKPARRTAS